MTQPPYPGTTPVTPPPAPPAPPAPHAPPAPPAPPGNSPSAPPVSPPPTPPIVPAPTRPLLRSSRTIQGNVLAAFNKDHQAFRMVTLPADPARARAWLAGLLGQIAVTEDVEDWNEAFAEARRDNGGLDPDMHVVWVGLTLTAAGLEVLAQDPGRVSTDLAEMPALTVGPAARAATLGDVGPSDPTKWLFGASGQPSVHAVVTVAADIAEHLAERELLLDAHDAAHGVSTAFRQNGDTLPGDRAGHEHFGYKDGISQPGVTDFHPTDAHGDRDGHPGTTMAPAANFVFGQDSNPQQVPAWLHDGSAHVLRRLEQDVQAWRTQLNTLAATVTSPTGPLTPDRLGELMMGRAKDGTPLATPTDPARGLGTDGNDFDYATDPAGKVTPCAAHIRKTHPRSFFPNPRMMRRGIPFGAPFDTDPTGKRGLVFNCFVTSIEGQFEFIQQSWANNPGFPAGTITGPDPVIGSDGQFNLALTEGTHCTLPVARSVVTAGAVYGLALSIPTLRALATSGQLPA
jgi:Dyp-type peroxidase family